MHGGVRVAPKRAGDLGVAVGGQFPREVGHQAPGNHGAGVAAAAEQVLAAHPHAVADRLDDVAEADGDCARGRAGVLAEQPVDGAGADLSAQAVELDQRAEPGDGALDLADRPGASAGDRLLRGGGEVQSALPGEAADELHARAAVGAVDLDHHARQEAADERLAEAADVAGVLVGDDGHAGAREVDGVDGVEELGLRGRLVGEEVHVVDRQQVDAAKALAEGVERTVPHGGDVLVGELLGGDVLDHLARGAFGPSATQSLNEVGLAHTALAVEEENRGRLPGAIADLLACREGESVGLTHDEVLEASQGMVADGLAAGRSATGIFGERSGGVGLAGDMTGAGLVAGSAVACCGFADACLRDRHVDRGLRAQDLACHALEGFAEVPEDPVPHVGVGGHDGDGGAVHGDRGSMLEPQAEAVRPDLLGQPRAELLGPTRVGWLGARG